MEHLDFCRLIQASQILTCLVGWNVLQTDDMDVFVIDLTLFTQGSLSTLLFEALLS